MNQMSPAAIIAKEAVSEALAPPPKWIDPDLSLIKQDVIGAPAVPNNVLPKNWLLWTKSAAEGAGAPPAFVTCALLAAVGGLVGNARWAAPWGDWKEPPAVSVALIGRPSSGKSPALDQVVSLLSTLEAEANTNFPDRQREAKRDAAVADEKMHNYDAEVKEAVKLGLIPPLPPADCLAPKIPQRRRIFSTESTIEKAARLSEANPRGMILLRDELAGWIGSMDRYSGGAGGDRPFWLQGYGGRPWCPDRVKDADPVYVPHLLWSIIGTIQPDRVATLMMGGDDDGLSARFLYAWPEAIAPRRPQVHGDKEGALRRLRRLRELPWEEPEPRVLRFTEPAAVALQEWRLEVATMEESAAGLMLSWLGKLPGLAVRLALILELLAWTETSEGTSDPETVSEVSVLASVTFLTEFAIPMARRTFGAAALPEVERDARILARWIVRQQPVPAIINSKSLRRMAGGPSIPDATRMEAALRELEAAGWVRDAPSRAIGYGRQRKDWEVNPAVREVKP